MRRAISDEKMRAEIELLSKDEDVRLAKAEYNAQRRQMDKERQKLYTLRYLKKRGAALRAQGASVEDFDCDYDAILTEDDAEEYTEA